MTLASRVFSSYPHAHLVVDRASARMDEEVVIRASGLKPNDEVTIAAHTEERGTKFYSYACFVADGNGEINLSEMEPASGRYSGKMPMGLVCSLASCQPPDKRLLKCDVTTPLKMDFSLLEGNIQTLQELQCADSRVLASCTCHRWYMAPGVQRVNVPHPRIKATMFIPPGKGPWPGVLDLRGTEPNVELRAALLASRGFVTMHLEYMQKPRSFQFRGSSLDVGCAVVPDLEYFVEAVDILHGHPSVLRKGIGVIGNCLGAEKAALLSVCSPKVLKNMGKMAFRDMYLLQKEKARDAFIPLEMAENVHFMVIHGLDNQYIPMEFAFETVERLNASGKVYETMFYPGAGHLLEPPYSAHTYRSFYATFGAVCTWGGNVSQHAYAQLDSWRRMQKFLREKLSPM